MDHVLFVADVHKDKIEDYKKYHKEMSAQFLKEKKAFGEVREFIWLVGNKAIVYMMVENFDEFMKKSAETETFKAWVKKFEPVVASEWQMPDKMFDFETQLKEALEKDV